MYAPPAERNAQPFPRGPVLAPAHGMTSTLGVGPMDLVPESEGRGMLASPVFWLGGAASVLCWTGLAMALLRWV